jgi:hypothetical protein
MPHSEQKVILCLTTLRETLGTNQEHQVATPSTQLSPPVPSHMRTFPLYPNHTSQPDTQENIPW